MPLSDACVFSDEIDPAFNSACRLPLDVISWHRYAPVVRCLCSLQSKVRRCVWSCDGCAANWCIFSCVRAGSWKVQHSQAPRSLQVVRNSIRVNSLQIDRGLQSPQESRDPADGKILASIWNSPRIYGCLQCGEVDWAPTEAKMFAPEWDGSQSE